MPSCHKMSEYEIELIWTFREYLAFTPGALPRFLRSCIGDSSKYQIALDMMQRWVPIEFRHTIFLLSGFFTLNSIYNKDTSIHKTTIEFCYEIRKFAVENLTICGSDA